MTAVTTLKLSDLLTELDTIKRDCSKQVLAACFETPEDYLAYMVKHPPTLIAFGLKMTHALGCHPGVPSVIHVPADAIVLLWRDKNGEPSRSIDDGPACVELQANGFAKGHHYFDGAKVPGHDDWRKRCRSTNHWLSLL